MPRLQPIIPAIPDRGHRLQDAARGVLGRRLPAFRMEQPADIVRVAALGSRLIGGAALILSTLVGLLMLLDLELGWHAIPLTIVAAAALLGSAALALALRRFRRPRRDAESELARLERAADIATTANLAKSRYLANVSHEIRSPLNTIYGYAQLIERDSVTPQEAARVIRRCTEHLTSLVEGLLDISQVENGMLRLRSDAVPLGAFLENIVAMMHPIASAKGLELVYEPPARLPALVRMDQSRLQQVLINLLSNAIKFTDRGRVWLKLRYAGQIATFDIVDEGPGIAADEQERIFEAFGRGADAEASGQPGAGLGLTISRAIVAILGGKLELESSPGEGACFRVTMMLGEVSGQAAPQAERAEARRYRGARKAVLVVDDDPEQRLLLGRMLGALDLEVVAAGSGEEALERASVRGFDLAILDINLPGASGWDVARALRARAGGVRILMLSANVQELHRPSFSDPPYDHFLAKPFDFDALTRAAADLLGLEWSTAAAPPAVAAAPPAERGVALPGEALAHVDRIRELLRIGYVRGIENEIRQLAEGAPEASGLADQLYGCLDRYDLAGIERTLERI